MKRNETRKEVNGFTFVNSHGATREGFYHKTELYNEAGQMIAKARVNYINRTWEVYPYQTSMMKAVRQCMEKYEGNALVWYKKAYQIKRMTKKNQEAFKSFLETCPDESDYGKLSQLMKAL